MLRNSLRLQHQRIASFVLANSIAVLRGSLSERKNSPGIRAVELHGECLGGVERDARTVIPPTDDWTRRASQRRVIVEIDIAEGTDGTARCCPHRLVRSESVSASRLRAGGDGKGDALLGVTVTRRDFDCVAGCFDGAGCGGRVDLNVTCDRRGVGEQDAERIGGEIQTRETEIRDKRIVLVISRHI